LAVGRPAPAPDGDAGLAVDVKTSRTDRTKRDFSAPLEIGLIPAALITAGAVGITATVTAIGARPTTGASSGGSALAALARAISVGVPLAVSLYACGRPASARFGRVLLVVSGAWFLASVAASSSPLVYSFGRLWTWIVELPLVYALLAFPSGRLGDRRDRALIVASTAVLTVAVSTASFRVRYPEPSPASSCYLTCPHNAFLIVGSQPPAIQRLVDPAWQLVAAIVFVLVAVRLARRIGEANALVCRTLTPVLVVAIVHLITQVVALVARRTDPGSAFMEGAEWVVAFTVPAFALAFLVGLGRWRLFVTAGVRKVNAGLRGLPGAEEARALLASAFDDPGLEIAAWSNRRRRWINTRGEPLGRPSGESRRYLTEIRDGDRRIVAILHDAELAGDPAFVEVAAAAASVAFATDRVAARTSALVRELKDARSRIVAAGDSERRRIERDLHDGAQQHLVALAIHLELAAEKAEIEQPADAEGLRELAAEVDQALEQLRALTRGMPPSALTNRGLASAIRSAAHRSPVPATVEANGLRDYPDEINTAVYFCCVEALQNVAKHARRAGSARVELREVDRVLTFSVSDDGPGISDHDARVGAGLINMRDRITTVGGRLIVHSRLGEGTRVSGRIPLAALESGTARDESPVGRRGSVERPRDHTRP